MTRPHHYRAVALPQNPMRRLWTSSPGPTTRPQLIHGLHSNNQGAIPGDNPRCRRRRCRRGQSAIVPCAVRASCGRHQANRTEVQGWVATPPATRTSHRCPPIYTAGYGQWLEPCCSTLCVPMISHPFAAIEFDQANTAAAHPQRRPQIVAAHHRQRRPSAPSASDFEPTALSPKPPVVH